MTTKHGGHLGYFEGGYIVPDHITWLDRVLVEYADAIADLCLHGNLNIATDSRLVPSESHVEYSPDAVMLETSSNAGNPTVRQRQAEDKTMETEVHGRPTSSSKMSVLSPRGEATAGCRAKKETVERKETMAAEGLLHQNAAIIH